LFAPLKQQRYLNSPVMKTFKEAIIIVSYSDRLRNSFLTDQVFSIYLTTFGANIFVRKKHSISEPY